MSANKDIANAIRYAADNGAKIINMSFGKSYSPFKVEVDKAVAYAEAKTFSSSMPQATPVRTTINQITSRTQ